MANGRDARAIKRIRNEILVALRTVYPAALTAEQIMHSLLVIFPTLEFDHTRRDLHYLMAKGYVDRVVAERENGNGFTPWRRRWFRLSTRGIELADRCIHDPALEE